MTVRATIQSQVANSGHAILVCFHRADLSVVRLCVRSGRHPVARRFAIIISWMGNGSIYIIIAVVLAFSQGMRAIIIIAIGALNIGLLHVLYPIIKTRVARPRPYRSHSDLVPLLGVLDEHAFPSGHALTLTGALVPIVLANPANLSASLSLWGIMSWARLASAHHYPSDVLGGTAIGLLISYPMSRFCLATVDSLLG